MLKRFKDHFLLELIVFTTGAIVMVYEIIGSRILAPYLGTSTYVWTSLIGVILGSLSVGYWLGGQIADRRPDSKILSAILFFSSILVSITMLLQEFVLFSLAIVSLRIELKAVIAAIILFSPASILLGFVTPYAIKLKMVSINDAGKTVGRLYALSTIGSIIGTFAAGFILLPFVGSIRTFYMIVGILFLLSLLLIPFKLNLKTLCAFILFLFSIGINEVVRYTLANNYNVLDFDTHYNRVRIQTLTQETTNKRIRVMRFDPFSAQSAMFLDSEDMVSKYLDFYHLLRHFNPNFQKTLIIGGAGYSFPKEYLRKYPNKQIDVVEIDPQITKIAKTYFKLVENENLRIYHEDGRIFLNETKNKYDVIVIDAYGSIYSAPFQMTTIEAVQKMKNALTDNGVVILNLISAVKGESSYFLQAEYKTFAQIFPNLFLFKVYSNIDDIGIQNLILVATKSDNVTFESSDEEISLLLKNRYQESLELNVPILTDDLAPVEYYNSIAQKSANISHTSTKHKIDLLLRKLFKFN